MNYQEFIQQSIEHLSEVILTDEESLKKLESNVKRRINTLKENKALLEELKGKKS